MAILCDTCKTDITPTDEDDGILDQNFLELNGNKVRCCDDCFIAISEWINSEECKKFCKEHTKKVNEEMRG